MNATAKGTRNELRCAKVLADAGFIVWKTFRSKYQDLDMFGLFDVVGLSPDRKFFVCIQVKSNRARKEDREAIRDFVMPDNCIKLVCTWHDGAGWGVTTYGDHHPHPAEAKVVGLFICPIKEEL